MNRYCARHQYSSSLWLAGVLLASSVVFGQDTTARNAPAVSESASEKAIGQLPFTFEENRGQVAEEVKFLARGRGYSLFLTPSEAVLSLHRAKKDTRNAVLRLRLEGADKNPAIEGLSPLPGKANYFSGPDPEDWTTSVSTFAKVWYRDVYPGIDLVYYGNQGRLEYDFVVSAGKDPNEIRVSVHGAERIEVDAQGRLLLHTDGETLIQDAPILYQEVDGAQKNVEGTYNLIGDAAFGFNVGAYDESLPLVIDPILVYSTFLGGNSNDFPGRIYVDGSGNLYGMGSVFSTNFPVSGGAYQTSPQNHQDCAIYKLNPQGDQLLFSTYIAGNSEDICDEILVDPSGNVYLAASTHSTNLPTSAGAFQGNQGSRDAYLIKLDPTGSNLLAATYYGGSAQDASAAIRLDASGNVWWYGLAESSNLPMAGGPQTTFGGGVRDVFLAKFTFDLTNLLYATFLGGAGHEHFCRALEFDAAGRIYVVASTTSGSSSLATPGVFQTTYGGGDSDTFIARLSADGSTIEYITFLGGSAADIPTDFRLDPSGNLWVIGITTSTNFPTMNPIQSSHGGGVNDGYVAKVNADGTALLYGTYLGGAASDAAGALAISATGHPHILGGTGSSNFPVQDAIQATYGGGTSDMFLTVLSLDGSQFLFSTYLGGVGQDQGTGIVVDAAGDIYVTGNSASSNYPLLNPFQAGNAGGSDIAITKLTAVAVNQNPTADAGPDADVECDTPTGGTVTLDGTGSSDPDEDELTYTWTGPFGTETGATPTVVLPFGPNTVTLTVDDGNGGTHMDSVVLTVVDTTAPQLTPPPDSMFPEGVPVVIGSASAVDLCDPSPVVSNDAPATFPLGATTVTWTATDASGNSVMGQQKVTIVQASVGPNVTIGPGLVMGNNVTFKSGATVGSNVQIGDGGTVGIDVVVGDDVILGPQTTLKEGAQVGNGVVLGDGGTIGFDAVVGDNVVAQAGALIKKNSNVGAGSTIGQDATIGENTTLGLNVVVGADAWVKKNATIGDGSIVGSDTLIGLSVTLGTDVEVGSGTSIRINSVIGDGARIGEDVDLKDQVKIGDQVDIGDRTLVKVKTTIGAVPFTGSAGTPTKVGADVTMNKNLSIGDEVSIGDGETITADVADGTTIGGTPSPPTAP